MVVWGGRHPIRLVWDISSFIPRLSAPTSALGAQRVKVTKQQLRRGQVRDKSAETMLVYSMRKARELVIANFFMQRMDTGPRQLDTLAPVSKRPPETLGLWHCR